MLNVLKLNYSGAQVLNLQILQTLMKLRKTDGMFCLSFLRDKGIYEFISAARLLKRGIKARFCLAGSLDTNNPTSINIKELNKLKEDKDIEIIEYQKDIADLYSKSHIICLPSYREGSQNLLWKQQLQVELLLQPMFLVVVVSF